MEHLKEFEKSIALPKICLFLSGLYIYPGNPTRAIETVLNFFFYSNMFWLYIEVFAECAWLIEGVYMGKLFTELSFGAPCTFVCFLATAKSTPLFYHRKLLIRVVNKLREIHPKLHEVNVEANEKTDDRNIKIETERKDFEFGIDESVKTNDDQYSNKEKEAAKESMLDAEIVKASTKFLNLVINLLLVSGSFVLVAFAAMPLMSMYYENYTKGETKFKLPFPTTYFFDPFTKTMWPLVYFHQVVAATIVVFNVFGTDMFLYAFCSYTQMHFRMLSHRYENMVSWSVSETRSRLARLVKRHQELIQIVDDVEMMMSKSALFNIMTSSFLICLCGFNVTFGDLEAVFAFSLFLILSLTQICILCVFGDMLMQSSIDVGSSVYNCRWYAADERTKKNILFIITRTQKPCRLTAANFVDINLSAFSSILSRSWSYFALLRTMYHD